MRKETITKYEKEFLAWCKNKSVLLGVPASMYDKTLIWREVRDFNDWKSLDAVYVLNDSYSYYRKAFAEGKTVQYQDYFSKEWLDMKTDHFHGSSDKFYEGVYRIKPEEPKFKVGDWVKDIISGKIYQVNNEDICNGKYSQVIEWKPKLGEWCWFWNKNRLPIIAKLSEICNDGNIRYFAIIPNKPHPLGGYYKNCEPFIGQLPSYLKETK